MSVKLTAEDYELIASMCAMRPSGVWPAAPLDAYVNYQLNRVSWWSGTDEKGCKIRITIWDFKTVQVLTARRTIADNCWEDATLRVKTGDDTSNLVECLKNQETPPAIIADALEEDENALVDGCGRAWLLLQLRKPCLRKE